MGLGKTAQALAHVLTEKEAGRPKPACFGGHAHLVGVQLRTKPTAWHPVCASWCCTGADRDGRMDEIAQADLVISTYPLIWRDVDKLKSIRFHLLILDEAQTVKNPRSRSALALRRIAGRAPPVSDRHPMENHLGELWAQFDFLMPGFLGDAGTFQRGWRDPIEKRRNPARAAASPAHSPLCFAPTRR